MPDKSYHFIGTVYGAYDIIMMLATLHSKGYQQLRIISGLSPSGSSWRWHIYPKCLMKGDNKWEIHGGCPFCTCIYGSTGASQSLINASQLADLMLQKYGNLLSLGKGEDSEYVSWFKQIVEAAKNNTFPIAYADWPYDKGNGWMLGDGYVEYPPYTPVNIFTQSDDFVLTYGMFAMGSYSSQELEHIFHSPYPHPDKHELASVVKYAIKHKLGLLAIFVSGEMQATRYGDDVVNSIEISDGMLVTLKDGKVLPLMDYLTIIPWRPIKD